MTTVTFKMKHVDQINSSHSRGATVTVKWTDGATGDLKEGTVKSVRWDGLVFTDNGCIFTGIDKLVEMRAA